MNEISNIIDKVNALLKEMTTVGALGTTGGACGSGNGDNTSFKQVKKNRCYKTPSKNKKKRTVEEIVKNVLESNTVNPWAVCHKNIKKKNAKFERCVKHVKAQNPDYTSEGKTTGGDPYHTGKRVGKFLSTKSRPLADKDRTRAERIRKKFDDKAKGFSGKFHHGEKVGSGMQKVINKIKNAPPKVTKVGGMYNTATD